jgi:hypothetical protein
MCQGRRWIRFRRCLGTTTLIVLVTYSPSGALERDTAHYPSGSSTVEPALMPAPGESIYLNYLSFYTTDRVNNNKGDSAVPGFRFNAVGEGARVLHTWTAVDGVSWTSGIVLVSIYKYLRGPNGTGSTGGFGDLVIQPLLLSTAFGDLHVFAGFDLTLPTGSFSKHELVNPGLNYVTYAPQAAVTWLPTKELELSLFSVLGVNSKNPSTQYTSGSYVAIDYSLGYRPIPSVSALQTSVVGYVFRQFTDDTLSGHRVLDGHRARVFAVGPQVRYDFTRGSVILKWQHEVAGKNRPVGDHIQLQFGIPF